MIKRMKARVVKMLTWALRKLGYRDIPVSAEVRKLSVAALAFVLEFEKHPGPGEYKLGQVYGKMVKVFPNDARDDIGFAIQIAVRRMKGKLSWR